jgi:hypothetical protein
LGKTSESNSSGNEVSSRSIYNPYLKMHFDLYEGEYFDRSYLTTTKTTIAGLSDGGDGSKTNTTRTDTVERVTFVGIETVVVPEGVFDACRFELQTSRSVDESAPAKSTSTEWVAVDSGVIVKKIEGELLTELTSGQLNGNALH